MSRALSCSLSSQLICIMCKKCDLTNALKGAEGLEDIHEKMLGFRDFVGAQEYPSDEMRAEIWGLAATFALGYLIVKDRLPVERFMYPRDEWSTLRQGMVHAVEEIYKRFGNRLPWAFYGGYLFMAARPNPSVAERLPELKHLLPEDLPWECVDAVWHGLPSATNLYMHLMSFFSKHAGTVPVHGCGCNHYMPPMPKGGDSDPRCIIEWPFNYDDLVAETEVPVAHMLVAIESLARGLPHSLGESEKSLRHHAGSGEKQEVLEVARQPTTV